MFKDCGLSFPLILFQLSSTCGRIYVRNSLRSFGVALQSTVSVDMTLDPDIELVPPSAPQATASRPESYAPDLEDAERGLSEAITREMNARRHARGLWSVVEALDSARTGREFPNTSTRTIPSFGLSADSQENGTFPTHNEIPGLGSPCIDACRNGLRCDGQHRIKVDRENCKPCSCKLLDLVYSDLTSV